MENEDLLLDSDLQAAFMGTTTSAKTMADGSLRISIDLSPADAIGAFTRFGTPGSAVAVTRLKDAVAAEESRPKSDICEPLYGHYAKALKLSSFFRNPKVWPSIGTDADYLEWLKLQPCALSGRHSEYHDDGSALSIPAHVRRVEHGSGTAIKPLYSAIPLTNILHQKCHQEGDSAIGSEGWWEHKRIWYVQKWCWETLKAKLGYASWANVPPQELIKWALTNGVFEYLPREYKETVIPDDAE